MRRSDGKTRTKAQRKDLTFAWVYPYVLTHRCAWRCGYCAFPTTAGSGLPSLGKVRESVEKARDLGVRQFRITAGEGIENHPEIVSTYRYYGYVSYAQYLRDVIDQIASLGSAPALFPEIDVGNLTPTQLSQLRSRIFTARVYLESMDPNLERDVAHGESEGKWARSRLSMLVTLGELGIPVNSGIMVGIGESRASRRRALEALGEIARRHGHVQSVTIRPFEPTARTAMAMWPRPEIEELLEAVRTARSVLPRQVAVGFPMTSYPERVSEFVEAGVEDLGDFDLVGKEEHDLRTLNAYRIIRDRLEATGHRLIDRLSLFPRFSNEQWLAPRYRPLLLGPKAGGNGAQNGSKSEAGASETLAHSA